jgi:hypothetical protein
MLACRSLRAVPARLGLVASLSLAAGGALAQDHYDVAGTRIPAFVLLDGCPSEGACAGPNGLGNPLFVAPATGASWAVTGAFWPYTLNGDGGIPSHVTNWPASWAVTGAFWPYTLNGDGGVPSHVTNWPGTQPVSMAFGQAVDGWNATEGAKADSAYAGSGAASVVALLKGLYGELASPLTSGGAANPQGALTLPSATTAYSAGSLIANSATAASVVDPSFSIPSAAGAASIPRVRLSTNDATSTAWGSATIQVDLWTAAPTWTNGDRAAWSPATGTASHLATYVCYMSAEFGDGAYAECAPTPGGIAPLLRLASGQTIYWSLEAVSGSGVTGASKAFTLTAELQP